MTDADEPVRMRCVTSRDGTAVVVAVEGEIDPLTAPQLQSALLDDIDGGADVVMDASQVTFLDSSGLRVILAAVQARADDGGSFAVRNPSDVVSRVLEVSGLTDHVTILVV